MKCEYKGNVYNYVGVGKFKEPILRRLYVILLAVLKVFVRLVVVGVRYRDLCDVEVSHDSLHALQQRELM